MHEQSIVEALLTLSLENAQKAKTNRILKINLVVGELSGVVDESMSFFFSFLSKDTIAAGAELVYKHMPIQFRCRNCETVFSNENYDYTCPQCQQKEVDIVGGRELFIESMEVE
jgi:hydrogenase nickel incorporation protein HypA/HybF